MSLKELHIIVKGCNILENAGGVKLHKDPNGDKVKLLPLSVWKKTLTQNEIPYEYIKLSQHLDFIGLEIRDTYTKTRIANSNQIKDKILKITKSWCSGKFMDLTQRDYSCNSFLFSKISFKCATIQLTKTVIKFIKKKSRKWILQDVYAKPSTMALTRPGNCGGLGLQSVDMRAKAMLIKTFVEQATDPRYRHSLYLESLYNQEVKKEYCGGIQIPLPPYYGTEFFDILRKYDQESDKYIEHMTIKDWSNCLTRDYVTHYHDESQDMKHLIPIRPEEKYPSVNWPSTWERARLPGLTIQVT